MTKILLIMYTSGFDSKLQNLSQIDITKNAEENYP